MSSAEAVGERPRPRAVMPQRLIRSAIANGDLELQYQPIVQIGTARITCYEALLRMRSPSGSLLLPDDFLPAVVHTPVMHDVTAWVLDQACADAVRLAPAAVAINVAAIDVARPVLVDLVREALTRHGLNGRQLAIELTEHAAVQAMDQAVRVLEQLRALGIELCLDDFGTGYSSLLYLRDLPLSHVKIDRTFVAGIVDNEDDRAIVRSVIALAHQVGLSVVAEGVERSDQLRFLRNAQCDLAQGYLLAEPAPIDETATTVDAGLLGAPSRRARGPISESPTLPASVRRHVAELAGQGASLHTIAAALNRDGLATPAGTRWTAATVARALTPPEVR
jgi:EAL domain-containing protein (putative c-di-GMP-specific phosphodiesterase class I)